jgi:hypothetical protein
VSVDVLRAICFCDRRIAAMNEHTFLWSWELQGWFFPEDAKRRNTPMARYYSGKDHRDEPYVWHDCPFCGRELPGTNDSPTTQGDGGRDDLC